MSQPLRYEKQTYELRGLIFELRKTLRTGWPEEIYHQGLVQLLQEKNIPVASKPRKSIVHRGVEVHLFECDLLVWDLIILELKVLPFTNFAPSHQAQIIHYLKCWRKDLGLLVNFGPPRAKIKRIVWDEPLLDIHEDYDEIRPYLSETDRVSLRRVRQAILAVGHQYGLGYPETMYQQITAIDLEYRGLSCTTNIELLAKRGETTLARYQSDHLLVADKYLFNIRSILERPAPYEFLRTRTYLDILGLQFGFVVNFGKKQLQIYGIQAA